MTPTATVTKPAKAKGALKRAQLTAEAAAAAIKLVPTGLIVEVPAPQMDGADAMTAKVVAKPKAAAKPKAPQGGPVTFAQSRVYVLLRATHDIGYKWTIEEITDCLRAEEARLQA